ncbi:MAG: hypothetical protein ACLGGV_07175 [Bacteroidia bacterium]
MKFIKAIVYSNLWIAFGASCFTASTYLMLGLSINYSYLLLVFFASLFAYNYQRLVRINQLLPPVSERQEWIKQHQKIIRVLTLFAFVLSCAILLFDFTLDDAFKLFPALFIVLLYATFFINQKFGLRDVPGLKIFLIASVWAYVLGVFPLIDVCPQKELIYLFTDKFLFILAITIPFDIRDFYKDNASQKTIPQIIGVNASKVLALLFLTLSFFIHYNFFKVNQLALISYFLLVGLLILFANPNRKELYFSFWIDGVLVLSQLVFY